MKKIRKPPPSKAKTSQNIGGLFLILFIVVMAVFSPALSNEFVDYDDSQYIYENPHLLQGDFGWQKIKWAFSNGYYAYNWHPLTWFSHMLDYSIYGLKPTGHHFTNILLHALSAALLFIALWEMTGARWRSFFVAAFFGLHPLRVESVVWAAERKDVLSTMFWMLVLWTYTRWVKEKQLHPLKARWFYFFTLLFFALGLMSKPMLVTLPFVLLLLDYWPLCRLLSFSPSKKHFTILYNLIVEKIPFFILTASICAVTFIAQKSSGAVNTDLDFTLRITNALVTYCRYLGKFFLPVNLSVLYPYPDQWEWFYVIPSVLFLLGITVWICSHHTKYPYLFTGWFWYLGTSIPIIGIIQVGVQSMADRYTYIPQIGILLGIIWGIADRAQSRSLTKKKPMIAGAILLLICCALTLYNIRFWKNSEMLFQRALSTTKNNYPIHYNMGNTLSKIPGREKEAVFHFKEAIRIAPKHVLAHNNLGIIYARQPGKLQQALQEFRTVLKIDPGNVMAHNNLGSLLLQSPGNSEQAIFHLKKALEIKPDHADAYYNLGNAFSELPDHLPDAVSAYKKAIQLKPENSSFYNNMANALAKISGCEQEALDAYRKALQLNPNSIEAHYNFGYYLVNTAQRPNEAIPHFEKVLELKPDFQPAKEALQQLRNRNP